MVVASYDGLATAWDRGAGVVYRPLAHSLLEASPIDLSGRLLLDAGCGTGAVSQAAAALGARLVPADLSLEMAGSMTTQGWAAVVADGLALPFGPGVFDAAVAGFLLNHLLPGPALAELARTVRVGGAVLATTWDGGSVDPVKESIDGILVDHGWVWPDWYLTLKADLEPVTGDPRRLRESAERAGLVDVSARVRRQDLQVRDPGAAVAYRLAMPHVARWATGLEPSELAEVRRQACRAVAPYVGDWRPAVIILTARVGTHPK
ncbi:MAG TPA: class I SAM-dependent methyltransferase [Acidimicrobiales bacterium]|jgi:SAM-dependent methyltransferase